MLNANQALSPAAVRRVRIRLALSFLCPILLLFGCATVLTGMTSNMFEDAPLALAYSEPEVIREQSRLVTLVASERYGMTIDGILIKELDGGFNPEIRVSRREKGKEYIVDLLPGTHTLTVTYDAMTETDGSTPTAGAEQKLGGGTVTVSGSHSGKLLSWIRTSETTHTLKGGEVYAIGLKMMAIFGDIELYPLDATDRNMIAQVRNKAQF